MWTRACYDTLVHGVGYVCNIYTMEGVGPDNTMGESSRSCRRGRETHVVTGGMHWFENPKRISGPCLLAHDRTDLSKASRYASAMPS